METLVSVAAFLIISGGVITAFTAAAGTAAKAAKTAGVSAAALRLDRFIRREADRIHVPYWDNPEKYGEEFKDRLRRSPEGRYLQKIEPYRDRSGLIRGVTVWFEIGGRSARTTALFPSVPVIGKQNEQTGE
jgi:hypothetical protein